MEIYLVGGAVRDQLLGLPVKERDWVVVGATPGHMLEQGYKQVGRDFPVFLHPETGEEYALARTERKSAPGYTGFQVHATPDVSLEEDLRRRDLTINAMALSQDGALIDPFHGEADLRDGLLRHVSPAFVEDPLRVLRLARFAARFAPLGFRVAHATHQLLKQIVADGEVDALVPERVWKETERALAEADPGRFFRVLRACAALPRLFPELVPLFDGESGGHGDGDDSPGMKTLRRVTALERDPAVRFAALMARLPAFPESGRALDSLAGRLRLPNDYRELASHALRHCPACLNADQLAADELLSLLERLDAFRRPQRLEKLLPACRATVDNPHAPEVETALDRLQAARRLAAEVDAGAFARQGLKGPAIGEALRAARRRAIEQG